MASQSDESFNRKFALLLLGVALVAAVAGLWMERHALYQRERDHDSFLKKDSDYNPSEPVPMPPQWVKETPALPEWWAEITVTNYDEKLSPHDKYERQEEMEKTIDEKVRQGIPPVHERRELIKYLSLWLNAPSSPRTSLLSDMATTYERLGEYKMAARIDADLVSTRVQESVLYDLAFQYEHQGDNQAALQIYNFMIASYRNGSMGHWFGKVGKARLGVTTNECFLKKPKWWSQYEGKPDWWTNETVELPKFTCFHDGWIYISHRWGTKYPRQEILAYTELLESPSIDSAERWLATVSLSMAYAKAGDHHRAIEAEWQISERLSVNPFEITNGLKFIAREFEALGETNHAKEVRDAIPCFSKWPRGITK